jgi:hypothetical protein
VGPKRALKEKQVWAIRFYLSSHQRVRDRAMFDIAIDSKLRGCDLVQLRVSDVTSGSHIRTCSTIVQQKTERPVQFEITETARDSLTAWLHVRGGTLDDYLFPSRVGRCPHIGTRQYARLVDEWVSAIGLQPEDYGTHSLRQTKASLIYKRTGNLRAVQILLGHTKMVLSDLAPKAPGLAGPAGVGRLQAGGRAGIQDGMRVLRLRGGDGAIGAHLGIVTLFDNQASLTAQRGLRDLTPAFGHTSPAARSGRPVLSDFTPISTARPEMRSQPMLIAEWRAPHLHGEDEASDDDWR